MSDASFGRAEASIRRQVVVSPRLEWAFDSSGLSEVLNGGPERVDALAVRAGNAGARVVLCEHVIHEVVVKSPIERGVRRAAALARLAERMEGDLIVAAPLRVLLTEELRLSATSAEPAGTPHHSSDEANTLFALLSSGEFRPRLESVRQQQLAALNMGYWDDKDAGLQAEIQYRFPDASVDDILEHVAREDLGGWLLEILLDNDSEACDRVIGNPGGYRAHSLFSAYAHLNALAASTRTASRGRYSWLTSRPGDWTDALIVAHYAYATRVITSDRDQERRLRYLNERGRSFIEPISLVDLNREAG